MAREVTRQEFLRTAGRLAAVVASGSALTALDAGAAEAQDDDRPSLFRP